MTTWSNKEDFLADLIKVTSYHLNLEEKMMNQFPPATQTSVTGQLWYESQSDDEEEIQFNENDEDSHLRICDEVHRQVRNTNGHCYNNDHIEKFYRNMPQPKDHKIISEKSSIAEPQEFDPGTQTASLIKASSTKSSVAANISNAVEKLNLEQSKISINANKENDLSNENNQPQKGNKVKHKSKSKKVKMTKVKVTNFFNVPLKSDGNIHSRTDFPSLV